jgi:hypothetical protein
MKNILQSGNKMDPNTYTQFAPIADELQYYFNKISKGQGGKKITYSKDDALVLLEFGEAFGINDRDYWKQVQYTIAETIDEMKSEPII